MTKVDFDGILVEHVGEFNRYQRLTLILLGCTAISVTMHNFIHTFTGVYPDLVCSNTSDMHDPGNNGASMENVNESATIKDYVHLKEFGSHLLVNQQINASSTNLTYGNDPSYKCHSIGFSQDVYKSTIVTEWFEYGSIKQTTWLSAFSQSMHMLGCFTGSLIFGHLTDRHGRKKILLVTSLCNSVLGILCGFAPYFWIYTTLRLMIGMVIAGQFNTAYVLALEIIGPSYRQFAAISMLLCSSFGVMALAGLAYILRDWRTLQIAVSIPSLLLFLIYICIILESPRWLLNNGKEEEAFAVINKMLKRNNKPQVTREQLKLESQLLNKATKQNDLKEKKSKSYSMFDLCRTPTIRLNAIMITFVWFIVATSYFGLSLYSSSIGGNGYLNLFLSGAIEVPAYIASAVICRFWGYKNPLAISLVISGIVLTSNMFVSQYIYAALTLTLIGKLGISLTFSVVYPYATELFPTVIRTIGLGATSTGARIGAFTAPYINIMGEYNKVLPLVTFGVMAFIGAIAVLFLPETRGKALPESIDDAEKMQSDRFRCCCTKLHSPKETFDPPAGFKEPIAT